MPESSFRLILAFTGIAPAPYSARNHLSVGVAECPTFAPCAVEFAPPWHQPFAELPRIYLRAGLLVLALGSSRCNCSETLSSTLADLPQIDVCVTPAPGAELVCYEAEKTSRAAELCDADGYNCKRPELTVDIGDIPLGGSGATDIIIRSVGDLPLEVYGPEEAIDSDANDAWSFRNSVGTGDLVTTLEPGAEYTFSVDVDGALCGQQSGRLRFLSNDTHSSIRPSAARGRSPTTR